MFSRCSKRNLYNSFKKLCEKYKRDDLLQAETYREAKDMAQEFKTARDAMFKKFKENKYGKWVSKPIEEEMFHWEIFTEKYRIWPNYSTVCLGFSKLLGELVVKYV